MEDGEILCTGLTMQNGLQQKEAALILRENTFPGQKHIKNLPTPEQMPSENNVSTLPSSPASEQELG